MKKPRIDTSGNQSALQSPFASLALYNLPEGPAEPILPEAPLTKNGRVVLRRANLRRRQIPRASNLLVPRLHHLHALRHDVLLPRPRLPLGPPRLLEIRQRFREFPPRALRAVQQCSSVSWLKGDTIKC